MSILFKEGWVPNLADFYDKYQAFMLDFVAAKIPRHPYMPETRRIFAMVVEGDAAIRDKPLMDFIDLTASVQL